MGRSKEKQAREEAEARSRKEKKKDSGADAAEAAHTDQDAPAPAEHKKRSKRSKESKEPDETEQEECPTDTVPAAAASEADLEGIERRRAREEARREKEEKKGEQQMFPLPFSRASFRFERRGFLCVSSHPYTSQTPSPLLRPFATAARKQHRLERNKVSLPLTPRHHSISCVTLFFVFYSPHIICTASNQLKRR